MINDALGSNESESTDLFTKADENWWRTRAKLPFQTVGIAQIIPSNPTQNYSSPIEQQKPEPF